MASPCCPGICSVQVTLSACSIRATYVPCPRASNSCVHTPAACGAHHCDQAFLVCMSGYVPSERTAVVGVAVGRGPCRTLGSHLQCCLSQNSIINKQMTWTLAFWD